MSDGNSIDYREIPEWPGYLAGNDGSVWSCKIRQAIRGRRAGSCFILADKPVRRVATHTDADGYLLVHLSHDGKARMARVHRLILAAFQGMPEGEPHTRHLNGDPSDNRPCNLAWGTAQENADDKKLHGTIQRGQQINTCILTEDQAREIKSRSGERGVDLAKEFGVSACAISAIRRGRNWRHL